MVVDTLQYAGIIVSIICAAWYLAWQLGGRLDRIENRLDRIENGLSSHSKTLEGILSLAGLIIGKIHSRFPLSDKELSEIIEIYAKMTVPEHASPLSPEEERRLNSYLSKARRGGLFTPEEVEDYNYLVRKLEKERKGDPNIWPLVAFGAFLFGLFLGSRRKEEKREE